MGLLDGRKALVFGVANDHSIAWGIAKAFHDQGAIVGFSSVESLIELRPPEGATTTYWEPEAYDWARRWPAEQIWRVRREGA